jgi:hypothetical protein
LKDGSWQVSDDSKIRILDDKFFLKGLHAGKIDGFDAKCFAQTLIYVREADLYPVLDQVDDEIPHNVAISLEDVYLCLKVKVLTDELIKMHIGIEVCNGTLTLFRLDIQVSVLYPQKTIYHRRV